MNTFTLTAGAALLFAASLALAQQVCTVTYRGECETADGYDCGTSSATIPAMPMADVLDNAKKFNRVLDVASKQQEGGGPYTLTMEETRSCDGAPPQRAQGIEVRGVTLKGSTVVADTMLAVGKEVNDRYKGRAKNPKSVAHDHSKAPKVKRDDATGKRQ